MAETHLGQYQRFRWQAAPAGGGATVRGESRAVHAAALRSELRSAGLEPLEVRAVGHQWPAWAARWQEPWHQVLRNRRRQSLADVCQSLAELLTAGSAFDQALEAMLTSTARPPAECRLIRDLRDPVRAGAEIPEAAATLPEWFDPVDVAILSAGVRTGDLVAALRSIAELRRRQAGITRQLRMALAYPVLVLTCGVGAAIFLSVRVLPQFALILGQSGRHPPALTAAVMWCGQQLAAWWWLGLPVLLVGMLLISRIRVTSTVLHTWWNRTPFGRLAVRTRVARTAHTLARLVRAGMPLIEALESLAGAEPDAQLRAALHATAEAVRRGEDLSAGVGRSGMLDGEFIHLLQIGEHSGNLAGVLEQIAERQQALSQSTAEQVAHLAGPLAIMVVSVLVGIVVLATVLPLSALGDAS